MTAIRNSFRKSERLKNIREFRSVLRKGSSFREGGIVLYYLGGCLRRSRLGIVVSRRVFRSAAKRNRAKRIVREFFRLRKGDFRGSYDVVVKFTDSGNSLERNNLKRMLTHLFRQAGVFGAGA